MIWVVWQIVSLKMHHLIQSRLHQISSQIRCPFHTLLMAAQVECSELDIGDGELLGC